MTNRRHLFWVLLVIFGVSACGSCQETDSGWDLDTSWAEDSSSLDAADADTQPVYDAKTSADAADSQDADPVSPDQGLPPAEMRTCGLDDASDRNCPNCADDDWCCEIPQTQIDEAEYGELCRMTLLPHIRRYVMCLNLD